MNEIEAKLNQIAENLLVQTKLVERFERRAEERLSDHEERMDRIETGVEHLAHASAELKAVATAREERLDRMHEEFADGNRILQAALNRLAEDVDRFLRGQQGDGRG